MKLKWRHVFITLGLLLLVVLVMDFNRRMEALNRLTSQVEKVRLEGTAVMQTQETLMTQVAFASSTEAVEEWAYREGHWVREGENPIGLVPAGNVTPSPAPASTPLEQNLPNWRIWWELFFGDR